MEKPGWGWNIKLPIDQRAILINPQEGTAGSAGGIDKMQSRDKAGGDIAWRC